MEGQRVFYEINNLILLNFIPSILFFDLKKLRFVSIHLSLKVIKVAKVILRIGHKNAGLSWS